MWAVPCYAVRCHEHMNTSIKMCVCIVRDGVQMMLPVGSRKENVFTTLRMPESRTHTFEFELESVHSSL